MITVLKMMMKESLEGGWYHNHIHVPNRQKPMTAAKIRAPVNAAA